MQGAGGTALLLSQTDFRDEAAAQLALRQTEVAIKESGNIPQAGHRVINIIRIYHLNVSNRDKQIFGYALQKAFGEWMMNGSGYRKK